jgi:hypothetical protein
MCQDYVRAVPCRAVLVLTTPTPLDLLCGLLQGYEGSKEQECGKAHSVDDPQFLGSGSFSGCVLRCTCVGFEDVVASIVYHRRPATSRT